MSQRGSRRRGGPIGRRGLVLLAAGALVAAAVACSSSPAPGSTAAGTGSAGSATSSTVTGSSPSGTGTTPGRGSIPGTSPPARWTATVSAEHEVNPGLRQGLARNDGGAGWVLSTNNALYRTDDAFVATNPPGDKLDPAIPATLAAQTYDHIGDIDIADGVLWAPIEKGDKEAGEQVLARYDARTLTFRDSFVIPQHHAAFVTIDPEGVLWSTDEFSDDTLQRYRLVGASLEKLAPLKMSQEVDRIQGGDIAAGAIWLSTDDDHDGLYRVDLASGQVQDIGSAGHADGEGEGDDAQPGPGDGVTMAVLAADAKLVPMRVITLTARPSGS